MFVLSVQKINVIMDVGRLSRFQSLSDVESYFKTNDNSRNIVISSETPEVCKGEPCILGVDEAGRGPVLGPMVYGVSYCPLSKVDVFKDLGCADSKSLTETKREDIFENIFKYSDSIGWMVEAIAANTICNNMLRRQKYTLNQLAQDSTVNLIKKVLEQRVYIAEVYVDTVGPPEKYQERLSQIFPDLKITVAKKADATYPVVSAASICAKVCRDTALKVWAFREGLALTAEEFGSGYPNDPVTKKFLLENMDPVFGFPQLVRFSWSTASRLLEDNAVNVEWEDIEEDAPAESPRASLLPFLKRIPSSSGKENRTKHPFFTERNLKSTVTL